MNSAGWMHLGIVLLAFAGAVVFFLRRTIFPAPREGSNNSEGWYGGGGGYEGHSGHDGGGHAGHGGGDS
ncbi:hypothetical protein EN858_09805 [Mesorhizobium sp. M4B.F.Ca.ET.215.01.1.1]|uniref:hypothetical protein n=1 Tax=unclassified Mesorhizobium TaxID=325217 RepID=UPI000FCC53F4|nr:MULTISPECIES: hypothetical protein [unclassified Mesorhizobium]RUW26648.1 hypothetical protein EOA34_07620 [Mesorhizobium sp. M4B.F.Ca.ET.013.02.1.1]RVD34056.1 hypothetical protein EN741_30815 [Mesorhizobium sp. M4B.F.Ca.ET.019.03.1.1]RWF61636.1 MAG: hypothetical protein EOS47_27150 [Mesorhizobium sp.]TGQ14295.1 hypothetical protein EN858_09805 [Mesorhizobium sp. M4B.F.Ca.ET.215.01.1.1]TGQ41825.1 hypothetical protein EN857_08885 [Mesorhizobium sp. M4B.F.Ca.ET.214.01.1.1]